MYEDGTQEEYPMNPTQKKWARRLTLYLTLVTAQFIGSLFIIGDNAAAILVMTIVTAILISIGGKYCWTKVEASQ
jgi:hypothetical protein